MDVKLALCLIVKNESRFLESCIRAVKAHVSEILVLDTGSEDNTIEIAKRHTKKVYETPFQGDFSQVRNSLLDKVSTPWVLFLDADESFEPSEIKRLTEMLQDLPSNIFGCKLWRYNFFSNGGWYTSKELKLFRASPLIRYQGKVGESVAKSIQTTGGEITQLPIVLNHFGHCRQAEVRDKKARMYLNLMAEDLKKNPQNGRLLGYMGMIQRTLGHFEKALDYAQEAIAIAPESSHAHYCYGQVLRSIGKNNDALKHYYTSLDLDASDPILWNLTGVMEMTLGRFEQANDCFSKALDLEPALVHVKLNQGLLHQSVGNYSRAVELFEEVCQANRGFLHSEWSACLERDPFRCFYFETIMNYPGLAYHLAYCKELAKSF